MRAFWCTDESCYGTCMVVPGSNLSLTLPKDVITTHLVEKQTSLATLTCFYIYTMSQHPLRQPHSKEQPKLKAKQNTRGKRSFTYPVDLPGGAGFVLLWPWYRYFSKEKVSLSVVQALIISHTERGREIDWRWHRQEMYKASPPSLPYKSPSSSSWPSIG